jgi:MFS family permease
VKRSARTTILSNIGSVVRANRPFVFLLVITGVFSTGAFNFSFILLRAADLGVSQNLVPLVYAVINIAHTIIGFPSGMLADKIGKEKVLIIGYSVFALSTFLMLLLSENSLYAYVIAAVFGIYAGISETTQRAVIPRYVSSELRGTAFGLYNIVAGSAFFVANVVFGFLWDNFALNSAILYSIIITAIAILAMSVFVKKYPARDQKNRA